MILTLALALLTQDQDPTIALWLFDETPYPNVSLTDAGPLSADLRLSAPKKALDAGPDAGIVVTKPLTFKGTRLLVNLAAKGSLRVSLLDDSGKAIPGFENAEATGDSLSQEIRWASDLAALEGKTVRLRFELRDAKLFAFQFVPR